MLRTAGDVNDAQIQTYYGSMIQRAGHTIRGEGSVHVGIENYGSIVADVGGRVLYLATAQKTNRALFKATNNGILQIGTGTITQDASGLILADGGTVRLTDGSRVSGGTLDTAGDGIVELYASSSLDDITNLGAMAVPAGGVVYWDYGQSVNNGTITVNSDAGTADARMYAMNGVVALSGTGEIVLRTAGDINDAQLTSHYGSFVQGPGHTIRGEGRITVSLQSNGLVSADVAGRVLQCDSEVKTNNTLMQATNGGTLRIATTLNQEAEGTLLADGGTLNITENAAINGGRFRTANGGMVDATGSAFITNTTNVGDFRVMPGGRTYCSGSLFTNTGTVTINPDQSSSDAVLYAANNTIRIEGDGQIVFKTAGDVNDASLQSYYGSFVQGPNHTMRGEGSVHVPLTHEGTVRADVAGRNLYLASNPMANQGTLEAIDGALMQINTGGIRNEGLVAARTGAEVRLEQPGAHYDYHSRRFAGGRWGVRDGSTMRWIAVDPLTLEAEVLLSGPTSVLCRDLSGTPTLDHLTTIQRAGSLELADGRDFLRAGSLNNAGHLSVGEACSLQVMGTYTQTGYKPGGIQHDGTGWTTVDGTLISPDTLRFEGGSLRGAGTIAGDVESSARVSPGASAGTLTVDGDYVQTLDGHFYVELGTPQAGEHDLLAVTGNVDLGGRLWVAGLAGYTLNPGDVITILTFASRTGEFDELWGCPGVGLAYDVIYEANAVKIAIFSAPSGVEEPEAPEAAETPVVDPDPIAEAFDLTGRRLASLEAGSFPAGRHTIDLSSPSHAAGRLPSGVYLARATVRAGGETVVQSTRVLLVR